MKSDKSGKPGNGNLGSMKRTLESNLIKNSNAMYSIQVRALLEHQTVFWRPHLWKTWTHPTSPEGSSVDGGGKVLDISSLINLLISQMDLSLFSLEWQRLWGMKNAGLKYLSGHQGNSVVHLAYLSREQISNDWMGIPGSRPGTFRGDSFWRKHLPKDKWLRGKRTL